MRRERYLQLIVSSVFIVMVCMAALPFWLNRAIVSHLDETELLWASEQACWLGVVAVLIDIALFGSLLLILMRRLRERQERVRRLHEQTGELSVAVAQADRRNHELRLIADMLRVIGVLPSGLDAGPAIAHCFAGLLPGRPGTAFLRRDDDGMLVRLVQWGAASSQPLEILPDDCQALRQGGNRATTAYRALGCTHNRTRDAAGRLCIPLVVHEDVLGMLHLEDLPAEPARREEQRQLALGAAEQLAQALANTRQREALRQQSVLDPLTGLFNRRYFDEALHRELARARRKSAPTSLVVLDLDHFKRVNDTWGHGIGDAVLRAIAQRIRMSIREGDIACRYGGEELVILIPECPAEVAIERAELLREAIANSAMDGDGEGPRRITASIGVAAFPTHGSDAASLFHAADQALYCAKRQGRNQVVAAGGFV